MNNIPTILTLATLLSFAHALFRIFGGAAGKRSYNISDLMFSERGTKEAKWKHVHRRRLQEREARVRVSDSLTTSSNLSRRSTIRSNNGTSMLRHS